MKRWVPAAAAVAGFAIVTAAVMTGPVQRLDLAVRDLADAHRPPVAEAIAVNLNRLGSGGLLAVAALLLAGILVWRTSSAWPLAPVAVAFVATGVVIMPLKLAFHRAAPHAAVPHPERLFSDPGSLSYPSGHAVNTVVWYGVLCLLSAAWLDPTERRVIRLIPPIVVTITAVYLGYHWLTDMLAGLCLGVLIDTLLVRVPWRGLPPRRRRNPHR